MSCSVCAVDVVGLVNWESVGRDMVGWDMLDRDMLDRGGIGWVLVDGDGVGRQLVMVGTRVLRGGGAGLVRPGVVWEPGGVGEVLQVPPSEKFIFLKPRMRIMLVLKWQLRMLTWQEEGKWST